MKTKVAMNEAVVLRKIMEKCKTCEFQAQSGMDMMMNVTNNHVSGACTICGEQLSEDTSIIKHIELKHENGGESPITSPKAKNALLPPQDNVEDNSTEVIDIRSNVECDMYHIIFNTES